MTATFAGDADGDLLLIQIGNGASPEVFAHDCLINADRAVEFITNLISRTLPRCDDQSQPGIVTYRVDSLDIKITGAGVVKRSSVAAFLTWQQSGAPKNIIAKDNLTGSWNVAGAFLLSNFQVTGKPKDLQAVQLTLSPYGPMTVGVNS